MANKQGRTPLTTITPIAGQRVRAKMLNGTRTHAIVLHAKATVDITGGGSALLNKGSVWALFDEVGVEENGRDRHFYDGRMLRFISETQSLSALSSVRLAGFGIATTVIEETAVIWMAPPFQAGNPHETTFREVDARQSVEVFAKLSSTALAELITGGAGTVTALSIEVSHWHDPRSTALPIFIPSARQVVQSIAGANTKLEIEIKSSNWIRGMYLQQEADNGERADIINAVALRGDFRQLIGPEQMSLAQFTRSQELEFGGAVFGNQSQLALNFQQGGRLSNILNPADDVNLKFVLDVTASGTNPKVRIAILELERVAGLVTPDIPFFV